METMTPKRIQLKRSGGWRMPPNTVKVDRATRYGNPYKVGTVVAADRVIDTTEHAIEAFRHYATRRLLDDPKWLEDLRGKDLACWCKEGSPCHADVLIKLANK
jgi:hypothetical protein